MEKIEYVWLLLGVKPEEMFMKVYAIGFSDKCPELDTEHEPRALGVLKKQIPEDEDIEGFKFHACRMTLYRDKHLKRAHVPKESKRWRDEMRRFLARCGLTVVEQKDMVEVFREGMLNFIRDLKHKGIGIAPLSESMWGKKKPNETV